MNCEIRLPAPPILSAVGLFLFLESVLRLPRSIKDREVTGSVLAVLVKPISYMAIEPGAERSGDGEVDRK